ncbi:hypothetical protein ACHEXK_00775 [Limnohabitans sp. DCL3]|uniref:hypothetical protein n=1 Tax=Limnohabitans sp. DCL3 TaxID=3374103 RepID=UPI003A8A1DF9
MTYAQKQKATPALWACCTAARYTASKNSKSLILLIFLSCTLDGQFVGRLDFQGLQRIQTEFSTKLSTDFMDRAQSAEKSMTYILFQENG